MKAPVYLALQSALVAAAAWFGWLLHKYHHNYPMREWVFTVQGRSGSLAKIPIRANVFLQAEEEAETVFREQFNEPGYVIAVEER